MIKITFHAIYKHPLPDGHRFPMLKFELIAEQLLYEGPFSKDNNPLYKEQFDFDIELDTGMDGDLYLELLQ